MFTGVVTHNTYHYVEYKRVTHDSTAHNNSFHHVILVNVHISAYKWELCKEIVSPTNLII